MKHVETMGCIWRMSDRNFEKLKLDLLTNPGVDLDKYGKVVVTDPINLQDLIDGSDGYDGEQED
jgi:hypothetical protein